MEDYTAQAQEARREAQVARDEADVSEGFQRTALLDRAQQLDARAKRLERYAAEQREDWPVHQPDAPEAPIPGRHWYSGCNPDRPRVNPATGCCEDCGDKACVECGREDCPDHAATSTLCEVCGEPITLAELVALRRDTDFVKHGDRGHLIRATALAGCPRPDFDPRVDYPERYTDGVI